MLLTLGFCSGLWKRRTTYLHRFTEVLLHVGVLQSTEKTVVLVEDDRIHISENMKSS